MKFTKKTGNLLNLLFLAVVLAAACTWLGRALVPVTYAQYYRHDLDVMKEKGEQYDLIFIGASRVYRSFDPQVFEEETDYAHVLNAGSVAQTIEGSYYLAKELIAAHHPSTIVLGLSYNELFYEQEDKSPRGNMVLYDRLEDPLIKAQFAARVLAPKGDALLYLSNIYRYGSSLSPSYLKKVADQKQALIDTDYAPVVKKKEYYAGNGFVYSKRKVKAGNMPMKAPGVFTPESVDPEKVAVLDDIVELCREKGVDLKLVTGPTTLMYMYNVENYQGAVDFYSEYAAGQGLSYYNLSMLRERQTLFTDKYMLDYNHVNGKGAKRASKVYAQILMREQAGESCEAIKEELFYQNLDEIKSQVDQVVAIKADANLVISKENGRKYLAVNGLKNDGEVIEYRLSVRKAGGKKFKLVYDYTAASMFDITKYAKEGTQIEICARLKGHDTEKEAWQIYTVKRSTKSVKRKLL